ncbi:MAG: hypothetical protein Q8922_12080 [Bacteroidota bacterium]|nr:hypothetical protein [Bacteroidota bacterium]MDP4233320.1 hypothetical protein [Bacteroidota bacterium]MDP4242060.1 hypothetical protein [Bacteroidota bacterium]MDP4288662.1 hypothetical protein [Bacteroidota bacterium]
MKNHSVTLMLMLASLASLTASKVVRSQAPMIEPRRIVLDAKQRSATANVYNTTDDTATYTVSWSHLRMNENGEYQPIDSVTPEDRIADSIVRFYPPEITLPPHAAQVVRVRFLKPRDLAPLEFRSHLLFSEVARAVSVERALSDTGKLRILLHPRWAVAIPVIVRNETTPASVSLDSVAISDLDTGRRAQFSVNIRRSGVESSYGMIVIKHVDSDGKETQVAFFKNVAVYPPVGVRKLRQTITVPKDIDLTSGKITVEYQTSTGSQTEQVQASAQLALGK